MYHDPRDSGDLIDQLASHLLSEIRLEKLEAWSCHRHCCGQNTEGHDPEWWAVSDQCDPSSDYPIKALTPIMELF